MTAGLMAKNNPKEATNPLPLQKKGRAVLRLGEGVQDGTAALVFVMADD